MRPSLPVSRSIVVALACVALLFAASAIQAKGGSKSKRNPIIFVHGGSGSGAQFESQALRFASNGYPQNHIRALQYDSSSISDILPEVLDDLDALIAELQAETGRDQVDLLGHSLGTFVSQTYLSTPERAAHVAHYVNIDGASADALPGGVPTLAIWAGAAPPIGEIVGATNVTLEGQEHIEAATSEEAFAAMHEFFTGRRPFTTRIIPEIFPRISGEVNFFPSNEGIAGAQLDVWWVNGHTGERIGHRPWASYTIGEDGSFGPFFGIYGLHYEFEVQREGEASVHFFYEPFRRSDHLVRLNIATGLTPFIATSENHTSLTVVRNKEFCGDLGAESDVLEIDGTNVLNTVIASCASVGSGSAAVFVFDAGLDATTDLTSVPFPFGLLAFLTAADVFLPTDPPGSIEVVVTPRGGGDSRTVHVPNLPSSDTRVVIQLNDFD